MKKIIYYPNPVVEGRLATIITEKPVQELIKQGIIKESDKYISKVYNPENTDIEYVLTLTHSEFLKFNSAKKPTEVVVDTKYVQEYYLTRLRELRIKILDQLDLIQIRALGKGLTKVVQEIEADKEVLRNLPATVKVKEILTINDFESILPEEILIDYEAKYRSKV